VISRAHLNTNFAFLQYFTSNTVTALRNIAQGTYTHAASSRLPTPLLSCSPPSDLVSSGDLDFALGVKDNGFGVAGLEQVQTFEGVAFGVFPVYNVRCVCVCVCVCVCLVLVSALL
jgi:hypothetical protein